MLSDNGITITTSIDAFRTISIRFVTDKTNEGVGDAAAIVTGSASIGTSPSINSGRSGMLLPKIDALENQSAKDSVLISR